MKPVIAVLCSLMLAASPLAMAQADKAKTDTKAAATTEKKDTAKKGPSEAQKKQQELMKTCNEKAKGKKGDEHKKFMSSCLKGEESGPSDKQKAQQDKMTACNKQAGEKKLAGEERKKFMSTCLKG